MKGFADAVALILAHEGGYANNARDPGGETNFGISKRSYPNEDIRALTRERAELIYQRDFWRVVRADDLPYPLALVTFDAAVNCGVAPASRWLQAALGIAAPDGKIGPITIAAARLARDPLKTAGGCCRRRILHYAALPTFADFGAGWIQRTFDTYRAAVEAA